MPNSAPIIRAMDWKITKDYLPTYLSKQLPDGDPLHNQEEIHSVIEELMIFGSRGRKVSKMYVKGEITKEEMDEYLDVIANDIDEQKMESFRNKMRELQHELRFKKWKLLIPQLTQSINTEKIEQISERLDDNYIYDKESYKKDSMETITRT